jgi:4-alpha-glucanotransferase
LGNWNPQFAQKMICKKFPEWEIRLNIGKIVFPFEYKFIIADKKRENIVWEYGENRYLSERCEEKNTHFVVTDYPFRDPRPLWKGAGTVIPVFALRSEQSFGIGDLHDLKLLIDWAKQTNQCMIQVLPMNDTNTLNNTKSSYPYNAISIYALNPVYISLSDLGELKHEKRAFTFQKRQKQLNTNSTVWYNFILKFKLQYCRYYFEQEKDHILNSEAFQSFVADNRSWLEPYAYFCYFRDTNKTADFNNWRGRVVYDPKIPLRQSFGKMVYNPQIIEKIFKKAPGQKNVLLFTCFLQFVLHKQFKAVTDYARKQGIILKGDLPIGVSRTSVEAWTESSYFNCEMQTGAPPDLFSETGQVWSFPTYNWQAMEKDGFSWWKKRFHKMSEFYDAFRIDHILGFFRIWEVPRDDIQGLHGHFNPALPLTVEEIEKAGFHFDTKYVRPRIHRRFLFDLFENDTDKIVLMYLFLIDDDYFVLANNCDTQLKIDRLSRKYYGKGIYNKEVKEGFGKIREGLLKISNEVLFIEDPYERGKYHPRIAGSQTYAFRELDRAQQIAWQQIANDFFYERHNEFWKSEALKRLTPLVNSTDMLICGEDLGMIPKSVQEVMDELHILSLELERTPKATGIDFTNLQTAPYLSVCTTSTHDMEPLREWWKADMQKTQHYYTSVLQRSGISPAECTSTLAKQIILNHLNASSMLTVIPLQDWLALSDELKLKKKKSERINIPENPDHYWNYRMHISIEQLLQADGLNQKIRELIERSGR